MKESRRKRPEKDSGIWVENCVHIENERFLVFKICFPDEKSLFKMASCPCSAPELCPDLVWKWSSLNRSNTQREGSDGGE